jgi:hypothetical protein
MDYQTFRNKVLSNFQTELVNMINDTFSSQGRPELHIYNDEHSYDEDTDEWEHSEVYEWVLINGCYSDMLKHHYNDEDKNVIFCEYKGQRWLGITCGGCCISMDMSVKNFMKKFKDFKN